MKKLLILSVCFYVSLSISAQVLETETVEQKLHERKEEKLSEKSPKEEVYKIEEGQMVEINSSEKDEEYKDPNEIQTIFKKGHSNGGYFSFYVNYNSISKIDALEIGSRLALIIGHSFAMGVEGTGFITDVMYDQNQYEYFTTGGYGGIVIEPIILPKFPVHISFPVVLGGGAAVNIYTDDTYVGRQYSEDDVDVFLIARPGVELEFNLTRYMRFCLTTSYRLTDRVGFDHDVLNNGGVDGLTYGISLKLGKF